MANGYVPHFIRPNPIMFPGIPQAQPALPLAPRSQHPKHPSKDHFDPPNYAHIPPGRAHDQGGAYPAPNAGGPSYQFSAEDHGNIFASQQHDSQCHFPNAFATDGGPNIIQRFWATLFGLPIRLVISTFGPLQHMYIFCTNQGLRNTLPTFFSDYSITGTLTMGNSWSLLIGLLVVVAFCVASWFLSPKGENLTVWRSTLVLTAASCYIMWAITFLAQWHPLIEPKMAKLREGYVGGS